MIRQSRFYKRTRSRRLLSLQSSERARAPIHYAAKRTWDFHRFFSFHIDCRRSGHYDIIGACRNHRIRGGGGSRGTNVVNFNKIPSNKCGIQNDARALLRVVEYFRTRRNVCTCRCTTHKRVKRISLYYTRRRTRRLWRGCSNQPTPPLFPRPPKNYRTLGKMFFHYLAKNKMYLL